MPLPNRPSLGGPGEALGGPERPWNLWEGVGGCFLGVVNLVAQNHRAWSRDKGRPGLSWVLQYPWLWEGRRATGSTCTIDVEGHKRRPPSKVGGLCHEFRVLGFRVLGFRVVVYYTSYTSYTSVYRDFTGMYSGYVGRCSTYPGCLGFSIWSLRLRANRVEVVPKGPCK